MARRVPAGAYARWTSTEALWRAWVAYRRGKRRRPDVAAFDAEADRHLYAIHRALIDGSWEPGPWRTHLVHDPKPRVIGVGPVGDRVVQHAMVSELAPHYERTFIDRSYACRTGRGPHRAALRALADRRRNDWVVHLDVRAYFASVDHARLHALYARRLADRPTLGLLTWLWAHGGEVYRAPLARRLSGDVPAGRGLPVGSLLSHFSGALYLDGLDHHVVRALRPGAYLRFMDDLLLLDPDRDRLVGLAAEVGEWLQRERGLALKPSREGVIRSTAGLTWLGRRLHPSGIRTGPVARRRAAIRVTRAALRGPHALRGAVRALAAQRL